MPKVLVAYYSRTGTVEILAKALSTELRADLVVIRPSVSYAGVMGFIRGVFHSFATATPDIAILKDPSEYDLLIIGAPVWVGRVAAPMRTYLSRNGRHAKSVAAFCVSGRGGSWPRFFGEVARLVGGRLTSTLSLAQRDVVEKGAIRLLEPMLARLQTDLAPPATTLEGPKQTPP